MATKQVKLNYLDLSGGQDSKTSPLFLKNNECELIQNYHLDNVGSLTKRNGITNLIGQIVDGVSILGMYFFKDAWGTDYSNVLVACNDAVTPTNSDIYRVASNAWAKTKQDDTSSALPVFASFIDYVFRTNGSQVMASSADLADPWGTTNCMATYLFKYICVWEDRVYVANDNAATNKKPSRIAWSSLPVSGNPLTITWAYDGTTASGKDAADINPDDNDEITWIEPFGRKMLVFKNKGLYNWTFGQVEPDKIIDVGTPQGRTVKQTQGICFFANEYGVYAYTGETRPILISKKIQPFIDVISSFTNLRAEVDNDHYYLYIGDVTVNTIAYANTMLVYTISLKAWHIETYPFEIKSMARFWRKTLGTTEIYDTIYLGDDDGFVYRKGTGTSDYLGTTAKPIAGRILTKEYPLYNFPNYSNLDNLDFLAQKGAGSKINYRIDRGDWIAWKDLGKRITSDKISGKARTLQFSITDNSTTTSQIEGFSVQLKEEQALRRDKNE